MSSGERNRRQSQGMSYGASVAGENVDFATDTNTEPPGTRDRALLDKLKDALKPGDARRFSASGSSVDTTHDGRHGGIEETMQPGHRDYDERENPHPRRGSVLDELGERGHAREDTASYPHARRGSVLDELGERATARETGRRPSVIDELGDRARARETGRRGSIFERMPFGLGQRQPEVSKHEEGHRGSSGSGGGVMNSMRRTSGTGSGTGGIGSHEHYRDSTDMSKADERHLPGTMYHTIRDDLLK
ncbi:hypothetical protein GGR51DRAFT_17001 [Nemania sp. FL0031]|nr:hypothetical protein GGR51DRAFT_17001 [Nemania sp. FL0031]